MTSTLKAKTLVPLSVYPTGSVNPFLLPIRSARWLLPQKVTFADLNSTDAVAAAAVTSYLTSSTGGGITSVPVLASQPGTWALPDSPHGQMHMYAAVVHSVKTMADAWAIYGIVQMMVAIGIIAR